MSAICEVVRRRAHLHSCVSDSVASGNCGSAGRRFISPRLAIPALSEVEGNVRPAIPASFANRRVRRTGFSLIEVVLALLLFAMGVLGVLALFPAGTSQNRDAQDFTYSAQFARRVFDGVLAQAVANTNFWDQLSNNVSIGCTTAMVVAREPDSTDFFWQNSTSFVIWCYTGMQTVVFRSDDNTNVMDHILRYRMTGWMQEMPRNMQGPSTWYPNATNISITLPNGIVTNILVPPPPSNTVTFWWVSPTNYQSYESRYRDKTLRLALEVWPGRYGSRNQRTYYCYIPRFW